MFYSIKNTIFTMKERIFCCLPLRRSERMFWETGFDRGRKLLPDLQVIIDLKQL